MDETILINRAVSGDADALAALLERHAPRMRGIAARGIPSRLRPVLSEDDVLQESFAEAFRSIARFVPRGEGSFGFWLGTLTQRTLLDALRMLTAEKRGGGRIQVHAVRAVGADGSTVGGECLFGAASSTPSRAAGRVEAARALDRAVRELPPVQRTVVRMCDLERRSAAEVAAAIGRSVGAVYMVRARALRRLRGIMGSASKYLSTAA